MTQKSRTHYSILNITTGIGGYFVNTIIGFICRVIFVRCLTADYLGINGLFTNVLTMLSLAELGVGSAIGYALYKPLAENDEAKIASLMRFFGKAYKIIGIVVGGIGLALLPFIHLIIGDAPDIKENLTIIYLLYLFNTSSTYFFSYRLTLLQTAQKSYIVTAGSYVQTILQSCLQMAYLLIFREYYGYLIIQTIGIFIYNFVVSRIAVKHYPFINGKDIKPLEKSERKKITSNIKDLTLYKISGLLVNSTDNIIITFFNGLSATGFTSNYTLFTTTFTTLLNQIFNGVNASIGNHNTSATDEEKESMFNNFNLLNYWLFGWVSVGIIIVSTDLVKLLYGDSYAMSITIPSVLALNMYMVGMQNAVWIYKNTLGIFHYGRFMQFATAILNIGLSLLLGHFWGVFGVLIASAISRALTNTWYDPFCVYKYGFHSKYSRYIIRYIRFGICMLIAIALSYLACNFVHFNIVLLIIYKIVVCSLIFNVISLLVFGRTKEFGFIKSKISEILKKIFRSKKSVSKESNV